MVIKELEGQIDNSPSVDYKEIDEGRSLSVPEMPLAELSFFLFPIEQYQGINPRLQGLQELRQVQKELAGTVPIQTPPQLAVTHPELFSIYRNNDSIPSEVEKFLSFRINQMLEASATKRLAVRRAFFVPEVENPWGQTYNDLTSSEEVIEAIEQQFRDAINYSYDQTEGAEIATFIQEWADPELKLPITNETRLPAGGEAFIDRVLADGTLIIKVRACLGDNAAMQVAPEYVDVWEIESKPNGSLRIIGRPKITSKPVFLLQRNIPPPGFRAKPHSTKGFLEIPLPPGLLQRQPALDDFDTFRAAKVIETLYKSGRPRRVEFSLGLYPSPPENPQHGIVFNEALLKEPRPYREQETIEIARGKVKAVINDVRDAEYIMGEFGQRPRKQRLIVKIAPRLASRRDEQADKIIRSLLSYEGVLVILIPALDTEHYIRELVSPYPQHQVIPIGTQVIEDGNTITITQENGQYIILNETLAGQRGNLISLEEAIRAGLVDPKIIGGKATGLCQLMELRYPVPLSFALTDQFYLEVLKENGLSQKEILSTIPQIDNLIELGSYFGEIAEAIKKLPEKAWEQARATLLANAIARARDRQKVSLAVRSNASFEDQPGLPFAGILYSQLDVSSKKLKSAVLNVIRSAFSKKVANRIWNAGIKEFTVPVLIQEMVGNAEASGTVFTQEITGKKRSNIIVVQAQPGVGGVVGGKDHRPTLTIKYNKDGFFELIEIEGKKISARDLLSFEKQGISRQETVLSYTEVMSLLRSALELEDQLGAQDIEWAIGSGTISPKRRIWYTQIRSL